MSEQMREGYRGYVNTRPFGGNMIPSTYQNMIMRDYCKNNDILFKLSINEYIFPNCFVQLGNILRQLISLEGIVMCSLFMLPKNKRERMTIY